MRVHVNGEPADLEPATVTTAVARLSRTATGIAVAVNGEVVPRADWDRELAPDDRVEILTASQGG